MREWSFRACDFCVLPSDFCLLMVPARGATTIKSTAMMSATKPASVKAAAMMVPAAHATDIA